MKITKIIIAALALVFALTGCSSSWLDNELAGSVMSQEQYDNTSGTAEATINGLYSMMYQYGGSHHYFGQKSIDITTDMLSSDMVMTGQGYGWFEDAAQRKCAASTSGRNAYMWSYYYTTIMNANAAIIQMNKMMENKELNAKELNLYAQALSMRAYCYYNIVTLYAPHKDNDMQDVFEGKAGLEYMTAPIYTESTTLPSGLVEEQPLSSAQAIFDLIDADLSSAISYFNLSDSAAVKEKVSVKRSSKLFINKNVAQGLLAYSYLQSGKYEEAYAMADSVIASNEFSMIDSANVLTTGFTSVSDPSWMWGLDVTTENTTALASFWGHMDVHTYSYAYSGASKAMDDALFKTIPDTDIRKKWFAEDEKCIPDWKFYDKARGTTADDIDRRWLNDLVYMRVEEMYLIAAEAAARADKPAEAKAALKALLVERDPVAFAAVDSWDNDTMMDRIYFNWRVEMWGEGRGLLTFKRFGIEKKLGSNSFAKHQDLKPGDREIQFMVPYGEITTNNQINK